VLAYAPGRALDTLNPAGGILDDGDGTGRHANRKKKDGGLEDDWW